MLNKTPVFFLSSLFYIKFQLIAARDHICYGHLYPQNILNFAVDHNQGLANYVPQLNLADLTVPVYFLWTQPHDLFTMLPVTWLQ